MFFFFNSVFFIFKLNIHSTIDEIYKRILVLTLPFCWSFCLLTQHTLAGKVRNWESDDLTLQVKDGITNRLYQWWFIKVNNRWINIIYSTVFNCEEYFKFQWKTNRPHMSMVFSRDRSLFEFWGFFYFLFYFIFINQQNKTKKHITIKHQSV